MKTIINDSYCHDISVKTRSALKSKRMTGEFVGACPIYGYRKSENNKNRLVVDDFAARVVQDIFRMKINGSSAAKIADELNRMGILSPLAYKVSRGLPHPKGGFSDSQDAKWSATSGLRILKDENYTGTLVQGRQGTYNYKIKDIINKPAVQRHSKRQGRSSALPCLCCIVDCRHYFGRLFHLHDSFFSP